MLNQPCPRFPEVVPCALRGTARVHFQFCSQFCLLPGRVAAPTAPPSQVTFTDIGLTARDNEGATALHFAARGGHTPILDRLLLMGAPVLRDSWGGTPLHDAAENGQMEVRWA